MSNEAKPNVLVLNRGDLVRAVRQCIADEGIDIQGLIREAVKATVEKRITGVNLTPQLEAYPKVFVANDIHSIRHAVATAVAQRIALK